MLSLDERQRLKTRVQQPIHHRSLSLKTLSFCLDLPQGPPISQRERGEQLQGIGWDEKRKSSEPSLMTKAVAVPMTRDRFLHQRMAPSLTHLV